VAFALAHDGRIFLAEKEGRVKFIENGVVVSTFLDINLEVNSGHDRGLLGIAIDPDFANTGHVYLNFTEELDPLNPDSTEFESTAAGRLIRISESLTTPNFADLTTRVDVLTGHQMSHFTHSVGDVDFDNAGNLIFTWGDGGFDPALRLEAQDENSKQGKLFRLDRFTFEGVSGNPSFDPANPDSTASKVWALGIRNSWKLDVDRVTGDIYMGEVTDSGPEEINVMRADGTTILNYGWPYFEGNDRTNDGTLPPNFVYQEAFILLPHADSGLGDSILGGPLYRGTAYSPVYESRYFFGNFNEGVLYSADETGTYQTFGLAGDYAGVVDMQVGPDDHIWLLNLYTGQLDRLVLSDPPSANTNPVASVTASLTAGAGPLVATLDASASTDSDNDTLGFAWDFDSDGIVDASGPIATHVWTQTGRNVATLIVYDGQGGADSLIVELDVLASQPANNLALGQPAVQSGTENGGLASRAVDGNTSGIFSAGSVTHTPQTRTPLWEVDLGSVFDIGSIEIFNRTDAGFGSRLNDFWVLVSDNPFSSANLDAARNDPGVWTFHEPGTATSLESIAVNTTGRYVRIQLAGIDDILSLAEVRVLEDLG
jgi:glucose/arabinose dehydrogenase